MENRAASRIFERPVFARARRVCLALPGAVEAVAWGHPAFRVGKKMFCTFEMIRGRPSIACRAPLDAAKRLRGREDIFVTPYGRGLWVSVWVDSPVDSDELAARIEQGYRIVAGKRMLQALNGES